MNKSSERRWRVRVRFQRGWLSKSHPWWFARRYPSGGWTFQCAWLNVWGR